MTDKNAAEAEQTNSISEQASEGMRARRAFMLKFLLGGDADWINKNIVAKGKGTQAIVGRVFGMCVGFENKTNVLPDGSSSQSVVLHGQFEYESAITGETGQASSAYLPMAYAQQLAAVFASDPNAKMIEVDVDIGLEATGKTIPYEWLVINHAGGEAIVLTRLRNRRRPGQKAVAGPAAAKQLEAPAAEQPAADAADAAEASETPKGKRK